MLFTADTRDPVAGVLGSRQEVVLFSKLNTLKFPNPPDIVAYLKRVLAPARMLAFQLHVRSVPEGLPYVAAVAEVDVGEDEPVCNDTDKKGCVALRLPFGKDFTAIVRRYDHQLLFFKFSCAEPKCRGHDADFMFV
jgi:hypothetical protein